MSITGTADIFLTVISIRDEEATPAAGDWGEDYFDLKVESSYMLLCEEVKVKR
mgnify:CR=1 FL=1